MRFVGQRMNPMGDSGRQFGPACGDIEVCLNSGASRRSPDHEKEFAEAVKHLVSIPPPADSSPPSEEDLKQTPSVSVAGLRDRLRAIRSQKTGTTGTTPERAAENAND